MKVKTIEQFVDSYIGHPEEESEEASIRSERKAYRVGMKMALVLVRAKISWDTLSGCEYPILSLLDYIGKLEGKDKK